MASRLALIIGNSVYRDTRLIRLKSPDADVGALAETLLSADIGGFDDVRLLVNMTSATIRREISEFYARKTSDDLLLLYFSGHGVLDEGGQLFLAVKDTEHNLLRGTAISARFITEEMDNSRSRRQVLILDCCHSGAFARGSKGVTGASVGTGPVFEGTGYGRVVLTASDSTQYAWEGDQIVGGAEESLFTHYLTEGLTTGEADINGDGNITVDELYDYVYDQIVGQTAKQTPGKWSYREQGEIVLAHAPVNTNALQSLLEPSIEMEEEDLTQRIAQLYALGLSAHVMEEWERAVRFFQSVVDLQSDYRDASTLLVEAQKWIGLNDAYRQGIAAFNESNYKVAVVMLTQLVEAKPDFQDASARLEEAQRALSLEELYIQAKDHLQGKRWRDAVECFEAIKAIDAAYPDPDSLENLARSQLAVDERKKEIEDRYQQALTAMKAGEWTKAQNELSRIQSVDPGYLETAALLAKVEDELSQLEDQQRIQAQLNETYEQARRFLQNKQWSEAIAQIKVIRNYDPKFPDPENIAGRAQAEIDRKAQETRVKAELEDLYTQAVHLLDEGEYVKALETWETIHARAPDFPDRRKVHRIASRKLRKPTFALDIHPPRWIWIAVSGSVLLVILILFGIYITPQIQIALGIMPAPFSSYILFVSNRDGKDEIYRMMSDGSSIRVTNTAVGYWSNDPVLAPGGETFFSSNRDGKVEIYLMQVDGEIKRVTFTPGSSESKDPMPDPSGFLIFSSNRDGKFEIYRMDRNGLISRVTHTPGDGESWAPALDRTRTIVFTSNRDGKREIYRLELSGLITRLTTTQGDKESWGAIPDNSAYLVFVSNRDGNREIYRMGWDGSITRVTNTPAGKGSYDPGLDQMGYLLFTSNRSGKNEIYRITSEGVSEQVTFTPGLSSSCCPVSVIEH